MLARLGMQTGFSQWPWTLFVQLAQLRVSSSKLGQRDAHNNPTILGIWMAVVLEACSIIKDAANNGIRQPSGSFLCKQEKFVELSRGKKTKEHFSLPPNVLALQSGLPEILVMVQNPELSWYLFDFFTFVICRAQRKGCTRNRLSHYHPNHRLASYLQDHPSHYCNG